MLSFAVTGQAKAGHGRRTMVFLEDTSDADDHQVQYPYFAYQEIQHGQEQMLELAKILV